MVPKVALLGKLFIALVTLKLVWFFFKNNVVFHFQFHFDLPTWKNLKGMK